MTEYKPAMPFPSPPASGNILGGFNWQVALITAIACAASLFEFGMIYLGNSLLDGSILRLSPLSNRTVASSSPAQRAWEEQERQQREASQRQLEQFNRQLRSPINPPFSPPPSPTPPPVATPSTDPDHWDNVRRWKNDSGSEVTRGRLISRDGNWITVVYKRGISPTLQERRLLLRSLSVADQAFVRSQFPDLPSFPPPSQITGETRPSGRLSPTNQNNTKFIPPANGTKPGSEVTNAAQVKAGDRVHIFWGGAWWPGTVLGAEQGLVKVHYDNHTDSWDELASLERVRIMNLSEANSSGPIVAPPASPPVPSRPVPATPAPAEMRTWTDSTGRFKLDAKLVGLENGNVKLERPDGKIVTMPLDKFTPADQAVVRAKYP